MSKPTVYNYKTAEDKIARLKQLVLYMGETIARQSEENKKLKKLAGQVVIENIKLRRENNELRFMNKGNKCKSD